MSENSYPTAGPQMDALIDSVVFRQKATGKRYSTTQLGAKLVLEEIARKGHGPSLIHYSEQFTGKQMAIGGMLPTMSYHDTCIIALQIFQNNSKNIATPIDGD